MRKFFFVLAAVITSNQLIAQDSLQSLKLVEPGVPWVTGTWMDNAIVTANKFPKRAAETGKVVTVIEKKDLERSAGKTLPELLNQYAGITMIGANNNLGNNITSSIRGSSAGNVLILIDGVPMNDPSVISNIFDINFINPDQVVKIEILKGGQSSLYGSDAVSGVINIITRKAGTKKLNINGTFTGGSYNTMKQALGLSGLGKGVTYSVNYSHINAEGFSSAFDKDKIGNFDKDGYNQHTVNARAGAKIINKLWATILGNYSRYKTDIDAAAFRDDRDFTATNTTKMAGGGLNYAFNKGNIQANYNFNHAERAYLDDSLDRPNIYSIFSKSNYTGRTHFAELYGNWKFDKWSAVGGTWEVLVGADYRAHSTEQHYLSTGLFGPYTPKPLTGKMDQVSPFASVSYNKEKGFNAELGGRVNIHSEYGTNATFNFNPFFLLENNNKFFANLYSSFKTPSLYQLFDEFAGNPGLKPETGIVGEAGVEIKSVMAMKTRLTGFYRNGKNNILYTSNPQTFESKYLNAAKQTNYGAELEFSYAKQKKEFSLNYTYTDGKTTAAFDGTGAPLSKDTSYFNLYRVPKHALNLMIGYHPCKNAFTSLRVHAVSKRDEYVYAGMPEVLDGYATIDLYGEYRFGTVTRLFLDLKNITNKRYFDFLGYNARRFNFTAGVSFQL